MRSPGLCAWLKNYVKRAIAWFICTVKNHTNRAIAWFMCLVKNYAKCAIAWFMYMYLVKKLHKMCDHLVYVPD